MRLPYFKVAMKNLFSKPSTENFPAVPKEAPEGYRGRIVFHPDLCIGCGICMRVCAPTAITKTVVKQEDGDQITMDFDLTSCTFCQTCEDFCPKNAIELTQDYAMIAESPDDLIVSGTFFKKKPAPRTPPPKKPEAAAKSEATATEKKAETAAKPEAAAPKKEPEASAKPSTETNPEAKADKSSETTK